MANENCLEGIRCPHCGNQDRFMISAGVIAEVTDDGAEVAPPEYGIGFEWDNDSHCHCPECGLDGPLKDFQFLPGLPPNTKGMNECRAEWAGIALASFRSATGADEADTVRGLLANLMHWCDRNGQDFDRELASAQYHYGEETHDDESSG